MKVSVVVCRGPVCGDKRGSAALTAHLGAILAARNLQDRVTVSEGVMARECGEILSEFFKGRRAMGKK